MEHAIYSSLECVYIHQLLQYCFSLLTVGRVLLITYTHSVDLILLELCGIDGLIRVYNYMHLRYNLNYVDVLCV